MRFDDPRYSGKPFLLFLDCYVLRCIGELSFEDEKQLAPWTPKLERTYGKKGEWYDVVEQVLGLNRPVQAEIKQIWSTLPSGHGLTPIAFARMFVDENFKI